MTPTNDTLAPAAGRTPTVAAAPNVVAAPIARPPSVFVAPVLIALALVYVVWGSTYFAIRLTLASYPPFLQGGIRFVIAGALLFAFLTLRGRPVPTPVQWRDGAIVGVLLLACGNGGVVFAEQFVSSSVAAIFIGAGPLAGALWSACSAGGRSARSGSASSSASRASSCWPAVRSSRPTRSASPL